MDRYDDRIMHLFPTSVMLFDMSNHPCKAKALEIIDASQTDNHPLLNKGKEGSSSLHFSSPLAPLRMNQLTESSNPLNVSEYAIPCAEDLLILFPSWLEHYTDKNNNDLRTVISFNTHYAKTFF